jgi:SAM dependent carboxyl methyltransferase
MQPNPRLGGGEATAGMVDYHRNSAMQRRLVAGHAARIREVVSQIGLVDPEFTLVDYGCGPGPSAIETVRPAIEAYRRLSPTAPMVICHADQAGNDWNALFALVSGPEGYGRGDDAIRTVASIGSFYGPVAAPGSVALATSFTATHWLSRAVRVRSPGTLTCADLMGVARAEVAALAEADWTTFLRHRARELRVGGYLVVAGLGAVEDAAEPSGVAVTSRRMMRALQRVAQGMADDGLLDQAALDQFLFPQWIRTADELRRPLVRDPELRERFDVEELNVEPSPVDPQDVFAADRSEPARYGERYAGYVRGFGASTLRAQLFRAAVADQRAVESLENEFFGRLARLYRESPGEDAAETWVSTVVLRRR